MLLALTGWLIQNSTLVQLRNSFAPIKFNTVIAFLFLAGALIGLERGNRRLAWLALPAVLIGILTAYQDFFHTSLGIDELLVSDFVDLADSHPGRMSTAMSICLIIMGFVIASFALPPITQRRTLSLALAGSISISLGVAVLLGHGLDLRIIIDSTLGLSVSPFAAIGGGILGLTMLSLAWQENMDAGHGTPNWLPLPVIVGSSTLTIILWIGLDEQEAERQMVTTSQEVNALAGGVGAVMAEQVRQVDNLARNWSQDSVNAILREASASEILAQTHAPVAVTFVRPDGVVTEAYPTNSNAHLINYDHTRDAVRAEMLRVARDRLQSVSRDPVVSPSLDLPLGGLGYAIYAPITSAEGLRGYVVNEYSYGQLLGSLIGDNSGLDLGRVYQCQISIGDRLVYDSTGSGRDLALQDYGGVGQTFVVESRRIYIALVKTEAAFNNDRRRLPELALGAGIGITLLLGLTVHLSRAAEHSNQRLKAENEERRRIEAMLKVSDERLRLALDSTQIGIFEWNVPSNHVFYSPGIWSMLGYAPDHMGTTPEALTSLIHPDDLPRFREDVERQLAGEDSFIDPEYRIRTGAGNWRWLYTRAKTVGTTQSGAPLRIIGTLQDISERKSAEEALRESQSATRKLSLVAARTDNLVIISSPLGAVEWVNESFSRTMEYSLEEIQGRNPATFMIGPETQKRGIRHIRAAMARGVGVTTDIINYSKSGRKYHMHLEIQPVRNEAGEIETFIAILADITNRVETEQALRRAKSDADHANRAKSDFLASMSHEIRTPMNGVIGMTSLLMDTTLDPEQRDFVNTIRTSGEALLTIINDILDFSKIESGKMELEQLPFDLPTCIEESLDLFSMQAAAKRLDLAYHLEDDVPAWITGDVTRLRQILVNLVNNAVKFTPSGAISILVRRIDGSSRAAEGPIELEITVSDTGIGIPPERVDRLFKPFSQVDTSTTRKYGGTGLGLAICHRLSTLMGGTVRVESELGQGSRFIFSIRSTVAHPLHEEPLPPVPKPLRSAPVLLIEDTELNLLRLQAFFRQWGIATLAAQDLATAQTHLAGNESVGMVVVDHDMLQEKQGVALQTTLAKRAVPTILFLAPGNSNVGTNPGLPAITLNKPLKISSLVRCVHSLFSSPEHRGSTPPINLDRLALAAELPLSILLVEDNMVNQKVALRFLDRLGYRADAVGNGIEAVDAVKTRDFDLVLMDLQMPEMDGFEASREIRRCIPEARQPKIIALTANALQGDRERCLEAGMDDYITKPVKLHELTAVIRRQFETSTKETVTSK